MFRTRKRRAILLVSVLFISIVVLIFVQASFALVPGALSRAQNDQQRSASERAAQSGIDWARNRLSSDPSWCANQSAVQTFTASGLKVSEGHGQVVGWVRDGEGWSRFRMRFNYQDGPANSAANSDNLDDSPTPWTDLPYLSCNNLQGASQRQLPNQPLTVPQASLLLSVEGSTGRTDPDNPDQFYGTVHHRTVQALLKMGSNQPVTDAAISSAGKIDIDLFGGTLQLASTGAQTSRLRGKDGLDVGAVNSTDGDLRATGTMTTGTLTNVTTHNDDGPGGFYKIPASKVRTPSGSLTLAAGTYVVTASNTVIYYDMNYNDYVNASPPPTGTPVTLPAGMVLQGPNASGPKFRVTVSSDLNITASGAVTDFALIPDGGAPQSSAYGGLPVTPPPVAPAHDFGTWLVATGTPRINGIDAANQAWRDILAPLGYVHDQSDDGNYEDWYLTSDAPGGQQSYPHIALPYEDHYGILPNTDQATLIGVLSQAPPDKLAALQNFYPTFFDPTATDPSDPHVPTAPSKLLPADLELKLQGHDNSSLTVGNSHGSITLGSQVLGNGAALVSSKDISLIGTSTELSSEPGESLGLNLYAQGSINIDAFKLDRTTGGFRNIAIRGILYAWQGVSIFAGRSGGNSQFNLTGELVSYGGDPSSDPLAGSARTTIQANNSTITFDPSYVAGLLHSGPFTFQVLGWHEF